MQHQMLFTAGMTLLDSVDSILMLYSYTGFPEARFRLFEPVPDYEATEQGHGVYREAEATSGSVAQLPRSRGNGMNELTGVLPDLGEQPEQTGFTKEDKREPMAVVVKDEAARMRDIRKKVEKELIVKRNMMSGLSIMLTLMSIIVAFRYGSTAAGCDDTFFSC